MLMTINTIKCINPHSNNASDSVFLLIQADANRPRRHPLVGSVSMSPGSTMPLPTNGYQIAFDYGVVVTVWNHDMFQMVNAPDFLFNLAVMNTSASWSGDMSNYNKAEYYCDYTISP